MRVLIRGEGIAAACCAHLLGRAGITPGIAPVARVPVPSVMLSDPALALIRDVFARPDLLAGAPRIDRRVVAWGGAARSMPHGAVVVSEAALLAALAPATPPPIDAPDVTIHTAAPLPAGEPIRFGSRRATAAAVRLRDPADHATCWIEALDAGWLFLVPNPAGETWLLGVGAPVADLVAHSRLIAPRVEMLEARSAAFDACPRLADPLCGPGWLACGTAALGFDPICGDGAAQAVREAILAAAVIRAMGEGGEAGDLLDHYRAMLVATMRRHLRLCAPYYQAMGARPWWQAQHHAIAAGFDRLSTRLEAAPPPRYTLVGDRLVTRAAAA